MQKILFIFLWIILLSCSQHDEPEGTIYSFDVLNLDSEYLIILGDTQYYFNNQNQIYLKKSIDWIIAAQKKGYKVKGVFLPGDITDYNSDEEWKRFRQIFTKLEENSFVAYCSGNHDYDFVEVSGKIAIEDRNSSKFNNYVFYNRKNFVTSYNGNKINALLKFNFLETEYCVLSLEFGAREEVLEWANSIVRENSASKFIILTHAYLYSDNILYSFNKYGYGQTWNPKAYFFSQDVNDGNDIWEKLIVNNDNVKMVFCGHVAYSGFKLSANIYGNNVIKVKFDPTKKANGGDGWIQILEFTNTSESSENGPLKEVKENLRGFIYNPQKDSIDAHFPGNFNVTY